MMALWLLIALVRPTVVLVLLLVELALVGQLPVVFVWLTVALLKFVVVVARWWSLTGQSYW
jgi:hypothetical protein